MHDCGGGTPDVVGYAGFLGWEGWARTSDNAVNSRALYQLSYIPMFFSPETNRATGPYYGLDRFALI
jgi:hypothetical protein